MTLVPGRNREGDRANAVLMTRKGKREFLKLATGKASGGEGRTGNSVGVDMWESAAQAR